MTNESSPFISSAWTRQLIISVVVGSAAAAVTANVAFHERRPVEAVIERAHSGVPTVGAVASVPGHARRVQWRDPWAPPASRPDTSVPSADKVFADVADPSDELAPTF
jgi:hypothetical protein